LLVPLALAAAAVVLALRAVRPGQPHAALACAAGLLLFVLALRVPSGPDYGGRLFRAAMYGAYSGLDPGREELRAVVLSAKSPAERRQAIGFWGRYGVRRD